MNDDEGLTFWVVYFNPSDYPGKYVVRVQVLLKGELLSDPACQVADTLDGARALIPHGLHCQPRQPNDFPVVVETWF